MRKFACLFPLLLLLSFSTCRRTAKFHEFPSPFDTTTKAIEMPQQQDWDLANGLLLSSKFKSGRLSKVQKIGEGEIEAWVEPENTPINTSPWYAFRASAERDTVLRITLRYPKEAYHRYWPKISTDRRNWTRIDSTNFLVMPDSKAVTLSLAVAAGQVTYISAQEIIDSEDVQNWSRELSNRSTVRLDTIGESLLGRPLLRLSLTGSRSAKKLPTIVVLSRQHPPEVTGYLAMQAFLEGILTDPRHGEFLNRFQVLIYPLLNPDGVDLGHWRHTAGGIDGNRDWAYYRQPETRQVANDIVATSRQNKSQVILGLDFHSTWKDVYYTHDESVEPPSVLPGFKDRWLAGIERKVGGDFRINEEAEPIGKPTTMSWFRTQFGAEGITYEIGDDTPRDFVELKGRVSATVLIDELLGQVP